MEHERLVEIVRLIRECREDDAIDLMQAALEAASSSAAVNALERLKARTDAILARP